MVKMITKITRQMRPQLCQYFRRVTYLVPYTEAAERHQFSFWASSNMIVRKLFFLIARKLKKLSLLALSFSYQIILLVFCAKEKILDIGRIFLFLVFLALQVEYKQLSLKDDDHLPFSNTCYRVLHSFFTLCTLVLHTKITYTLVTVSYELAVYSSGCITSKQPA